MKKKILALAVVLVMLIGMLPITASAASPLGKVRIYSPEKGTYICDQYISSSATRYAWFTDVIDEETGEVIGNKPNFNTWANVPQEHRSNYIKFSHSSGVLTITFNNINYKRVGSIDGFITVLKNSGSSYTRDFDIVIQLNGENVLDGAGIKFNFENSKSITFTGDGSLTINTNVAGNGIINKPAYDGEIIFKDTTVSMHNAYGVGQNAADLGTTAGIINKDAITVDGANLTITGNKFVALRTGTSLSSGQTSPETGVTFKNGSNVILHGGTTEVISTGGPINIDGASVEISKTSSNTVPIFYKVPNITGSYSSVVAGTEAAKAKDFDEYGFEAGAAITEADGIRYFKSVVGIPEGGECTHPGLEEQTDCEVAVVCEFCNEVVIPAKEHIPGDEATCTTAQTCTICSKVLVEALGHPLVARGITGTDYYVVPTCTESGYKHHKFCTRCERYFSWGTNSTPANNKTYTGYASMEEFYAAPLGHKEGEPTVDPETYEIVISCVTCQAELSRVPGEIPEPECTHENAPAQEFCDVAVNCPDCGEEVYAAKDHTEGAAADCENDQICTVCEKVLVEKLGHKPGAAADCENDQICTVCEKVLVEKLGHKPGAEADCENDQICTVCEKVLVEKLGHKPGEPVKENIVPATLNAPGSYEEVINCSVCKEELSRVEKEIAQLTGAVCQTNDGIKFATLAEAVAHRDPVLITLLDNVTLTERITISGTVGIELNGFNITGDVADQYGMFYVRKGAELNLMGEGAVENTAGVTIGNYGNILVGENATVNCAEEYASVYNFYYAADYYGHATINGKAAVIWNSGTLQVNETAQITYLDNSGYANVIKGAVVETFYAQDGSDAPEVPDAGCFRYAEPSKVILDEGYVLITVKEATYKVHAHIYETKTTAPTCTDDGYTTYTCKCGDTYDADKVPAKGHTPGAAATCTTNQICTVCEKELAPAEGHRYGSMQVFTFCEEEGYIIIGCNKCGGEWDSRTDKEARDYLAEMNENPYINIDLSAKGHKYEGDTTDATCTENGKTVYTCSVCGDTYEDEIISQGHNYVKSKIVAPTHTAKGYTVYTCDKCGDSYRADIVNTLPTAAKNETTGEYYSTVQEAIDAAAEGETIVLTKNIKNAATLIVSADKKITIDLKDYYYAVTQVTDKVALVIAEGAEVTLKGAGAAKLEAQYTSNERPFDAVIKNAGKLIIEGVALNANNLYADDFAIINTGDLTLAEGATLKLVKAAALSNTGAVANKSGAEIKAPEGCHWTAEGILEAHSYDKVTSIPATCEKVSYDLHECACGASYEDNYGTAKLPVVAKIGEKLYASLQEAIDAAEEGDVIVLARNVKNAKTVYVAGDKKITIDMDGKYYAVTQVTDGAVIVIAEGAEVVIKNGKLQAEYAAYDKFNCVVNNSGKLTLEGVTVNGNNLFNAGAATIINNGEVIADAATVINVNRNTKTECIGTPVVKQ